MDIRIIQQITVNFIFFANCLSCSINDTHAIILARGGSKGIRNKNLLQFNGTTLLGQSIRTIKKTQKFSNIWVSTDDERIADEAFKHGASIYKRVPAFAQDHSTSTESIREFLYKHPYVNKFALFQCTSVFLQEKYIDEAVMKFQSHPCVFAVKRSYKLRWAQVDHMSIAPLNFDPRHRPRRQEWSGDLEETGMFYFSSRHLIAQNRLQNQWCSTVEIETQDSIEIDTMSDLRLALALSSC